MAIMFNMAHLRKTLADPARWEEFRRRFTAELHQQTDQLKRLRDLSRNGRITLVYAASDEFHNDAVVLRDVLLVH